MEGKEGLGKPVISFVIPTLQEESVLGTTLVALRELDAIPYEIVVSDGHSTDGTVAIARMHADQVLVHDGKTRQNIAMGRNAGGAVAQGEFLVFMDADVQVADRDPNAFFRRALGLFAADPRLMALSVRFRVFPGMETTMDRIVFWCLDWLCIMRNNLLGRGGAGGEFQMVRASAFRSVGGYDERLVASEDFDLFARLSKIGHTRTEPSLTVYHTGRRAHKVGWPRLLFTWLRNWVWTVSVGRAHSTEWEVVR